MKSWKTTTAGILTILAAVATAAKAIIDNDPATNPNWEATITAITVGFGLIFAKDANVTGGTTPQ